MNYVSNMFEIKWTCGTLEEEKNEQEYGFNNPKFDRFNCPNLVWSMGFYMFGFVYRIFSFYISAINFVDVIFHHDISYESSQ